MTVSLNGLEGFRQDLLFALRSFRHQPSFAVFVIATLATGIGASSALFSVAYGVSFRPLPFPEQHNLVRIYESNPAAGKLQSDVSVATFQAWREGVSSIESAALFSKPVTRFLADDEQQPVITMSVSPGFFEVIRTGPLLGSGFRREADYTRVTADREAVISYGAWQRLLGGRPNPVGSTIKLSGAGDVDSYEIVGVMPREFAFDSPVDLWRPTNLVVQPMPASMRGLRSDQVVARMASGRTLGELHAELQGVSERLARQYPATHSGWTARAESLLAAVIGSFARATWLLLASVAVVLLVVCINVAALLVARAAVRQRDTAVRLALGASRWSMFRMYLAESSLLAVVGMSLGILLTWYGLWLLKAFAPPGIPRLDSINLDGVTLTASVTCTAVAIFSVTCAAFARVKGPELLAGIASSTRTSAGTMDAKVRHWLSAAQCAGAVLLLIMAGLLTRSFMRVMAVDLGWESNSVLAISVSPPIPADVKRPWFRFVDWADRLTTHLERIPGIQGAAISTQVPLTTERGSSSVARGRGKGSGDTGRWPVVQHVVTDAYFDVMNLRLVSGRFFNATDRFQEPQVNRTQKVERGVVVVSETTARTLWPAIPAVGQALWLPNADNVAWREVIGVAEDLAFHAVEDKHGMHVFIPWTQRTSARATLLVKANPVDHSAALPGITPIVKDAIRTAEPGTKIDHITTLDSLVFQATAQQRYTAQLTAGFGLLSLLLSGIAIYGTAAYLVATNMKEIGIRMALGAQRRQVILDVVRRSTVPAAAGTLAGIAAAVALARAFRTLLFQVSPLDAWSIVSGTVVLLVVVALAALLPAYRASHVDIAEVLRIS